MSESEDLKKLREQAKEAASAHSKVDKHAPLRDEDGRFKR